MKKEMLINVLQPEECRIAIVEDGVLEELYVERTSNENYTGNIYKGRIVNLEPAIQAAFVDFSVGRNGFLHISDVEPQYYRKAFDEDAEAPPRDRPREPRASREDRPGREDRGERDRDRGERAPRGGARREEFLERFEPPSYPPQLEDRSGPREAPRAPEPPPDWDPEWGGGWGRERPDRSEKPRGRGPRRFGEGLVEGWDEPAPPAPLFPPDFDPDRPAGPEPTRAPEPMPPPVEPATREEGRAPSTPPRPRRDRPAASTRGFGSGLIEEEPSREVLDEPEARPAPDPIEAELPPSRTARPRRVRETEGGEPTAPRRGRGRSRATAPEARAPEPSPAPPPAREPAPETEPDIDLDFGFEALGVTPPPDLPRRRGRENIRARGGDRPLPRGRADERPREEEPVARDRERAPAREVAPRDRDRDREREIQPGGWGRGAASPPPPPVERGRPVDRAGEPGYVPRRERSRAPEVPPAAPPSDWDDVLADLLPPERPPFDAEEIETGEAEGEGRRPRRRRRRRRDERPAAEPGRRAPAAERGEPFEERRPARDEEPREPASTYRRRRDEEIDDLEEDEFGDELEAESAAIVESEAIRDEEIDPELEEEIRREIEEIQALEREMGLRGTTEARPRRGDDLEGPPGPGGRPRPRGVFKPPIQEVFRRGDEVLVQVIKESIGTKGPTLSTYISIPGRYLVLMPGLNRVGVSRKIADEGQRRRLREIMQALNPPKGLGFIVRTAGLDRTKRELARDLAYLLRLWKVILRRIKKAKAPAPIYQESDMIIRTIRDIFNSEIDTIWIDERAAYDRATEFMRAVMPKMVDRVRFYDAREPLFHKYGIEDEIAKIQRRRVDLPGGGSIVIDQTEALVAIDVNSGNFRVEDDAEKTAYEMNLRAAKEIARQLRLRDLGGVIVNDFIDMRDEKHRRGVERALRDAVRRDRARTKILRMSQFGLIEMTRQRIRPSLKRSVYEDCRHCGGSGVTKTPESMAIDVMRMLALAAHRGDVRRVCVTVADAVELYLSNRKRMELVRLEQESQLSIQVKYVHDVPAEHLKIECYDAANNEVRLFPAPAPHAPQGPRRGRSSG
jgi:ribonuclease E